MECPFHPHNEGNFTEYRCQLTFGCSTQRKGTYKFCLKIGKNVGPILYNNINNNNNNNNNNMSI